MKERIVCLSQERLAPILERKRQPRESRAIPRIPLDELLIVIFLDLDRFKEVNDSHGHLAGSTTLAEFGALFARVIDRPEATVARYGGDEFVALLPDTGREEALRLAECVRAETEAHVFLAGRWGDGQEPLRLAGLITASIGVSTLEAPPPGEVTREQQTRLGVQLLQAADGAMYASKGGGKNRVTYIHIGS